jgi:hypothetical protein
MSELIPTLKYADLLTLMMEPNWADVSPSARVALAFHLPLEDLAKEEIDKFAHWHSHQPMPVIGLLPAERVSDLQHLVDIVVTSDKQRASLFEKIIQNPMASSVLVQVVRTTPDLAIPQALIVESLAYSTLQGGAEFALWLDQFQETKAERKPIKLRDSVVKLHRSNDRLEIRLNSPENRNALSTKMRDQLTEAFKLVAMDLSINHVSVSGEGSSFSAGGDLTEFGESNDRALSHYIRQLRMPAQYIARRSDCYTFHLHGACIGAGIEMAAFAGRLVADKNAYFQLPEVGMGLVPGAGGCVSITRRIGGQKMNLLAITGMQLPADEARSWGLIDEIV